MESRTAARLVCVFDGNRDTLAKCLVSLVVDVPGVYRVYVSSGEMCGCV